MKRLLFSAAAATSAVLCAAFATLWLTGHKGPIGRWPDAPTQRPKIMAFALDRSVYLGVVTPPAGGATVWPRDGQLLPGVGYVRAGVAAQLSGVRLGTLTAVFVPMWASCLATAGLPLAWVSIRLRAARQAGAGLCPRCGYDLRATPDRCPECGTQVGATDAQ